jgi:hypothetical protein
MGSPKPKVRASLRAALEAAGLATKIQRGSVCVYRPISDKHSQARLAMLSAVCLIEQREELAFKIFCSEQYYKDNSLKKFSIKLTTPYNLTLRQYDLDTKRGPHIHNFVSGRKQGAHIPFSGDLSDVVKDILSLMRI